MYIRTPQHLPQRIVSLSFRASPSVVSLSLDHKTFSLTPFNHLAMTDSWVCVVLLKKEKKKNPFSVNFNSFQQEGKRFECWVKISKQPLSLIQSLCITINQLLSGEFNSLCVVCHSSFRSFVVIYFLFFLSRLAAVSLVFDVHVHTLELHEVYYGDRKIINFSYLLHVLSYIVQKSHTATRLLMFMIFMVTFSEVYCTAGFFKSVWQRKCCVVQKH